LLTWGQMREYGVARGILFPCKVGYGVQLCPSQEILGVTPENNHSSAFSSQFRLSCGGNTEVGRWGSKNKVKRVQPLPPHAPSSTLATAQNLTMTLMSDVTDFTSYIHRYAKHAILSVTFDLLS